MRRSASAELTPGTSLATASISRVMRSMSVSEVPATLTPIGLLIPVASMSMRLRIGGTQMLESPGTFTARSSSSMSFSGVISARHCSRGLNCTVVSNISSGAGSVAVSARPALPNTRATSGTVRIMRLVCCSSWLALLAGRPGRAEGM
ncbi:hypothetical protein D9M69_435550 [compost metagenome]